MDENHRRSGEAARAAAHILTALAATGAKGAALAAAQEAAPFLIKIAAGLLVLLLLIPMLVFTALPNMFFGYKNSNAEEVTRMTQQALALGGVYISLEDFENTQVDSIVTSIIAEYEADGIEIDEVRIDSVFDENDLAWLIAINTAAYQQDLDAMSAQDIRTFCTSRLTHEFSLLEGEKNMLKVTVKHLNPDKLMDSLGFEEEGRTWAGAIYEVLSESNALEEYAPYFEQYRPSYGGEPGPGNSGGEHGPSYGNGIDLSRFVSPGTKNNKDLACYAIQAWENNWGYVWGTYGNVLTESLLAYKIQQYPDWVGQNAGFIRSHWLNRRCTDCVGLIKGYGWLDASTGAIRYGTNGMPDYGANTMYRAATQAGVSGRDHGPISTMPEIVGLAVHMNGHIGVYIGNGYVIEAANTSVGVIKTRLAGRGWTEWCKLPYIDYLE